MSAVTSEWRPRAERLEEVLAAYLDAREAGRAVDPKALLADHPDLARELADFLANEDYVARLAAPIGGIVRAAHASPGEDSGDGPVSDSAPTIGLEALTPLGELRDGAGGANRSLGDFELLEEIARGGMGVVYRARQVSLNRTVALKVILGSRFATAAERRRFHAEAEAAARLDHPHIVPVYQVGEAEGSPYLCLKLVEGGNLAHKLAAAPLPPVEAVALVETLARAMHHAHTRGIVHRDLKPANVLLTADGTPQIADFGLAKHLDNPGDLTQTGQLLGTPCYMAPEQAWGRSRAIGPRTDVYALGAILYECLAGRPPFRAATPLETVEQVRHEEPVSPRLLNPAVDSDLEAVCMKCLEKDPGRRYPSALALAEDLARRRRGEPVGARSYNALARVARALEKRSRGEEEFRAWGLMLWLLAALVLVGHSITFVLLWTGAAPGWATASRATQMALGAAAFWWCRRGAPARPAGAAEWQLGSIWLGYLAAYGASFLMLHALAASGAVVAGPRGTAAWAELLIYPVASLLSGLAFCVMGGLYWGRYFAVAAVFLGLALLMPWHLAFAPLEFGVLWAVVLTGLGAHLRRLGRDEPVGPPPFSGSQG